MTTNAEIEAKLAREVEDMVAKIMRQLADMTIEQKLGVLFELDRWISMEQASHHERQWSSNFASAEEGFANLRDEGLMGMAGFKAARLRFDRATAIDGSCRRAR